MTKNDGHGRRTHQLYQIQEIRDKVFAHVDEDGDLYYDGYEQLQGDFQKTIRCECGARFYKEENAIEHIREKRYV